MAAKSNSKIQPIRLICSRCGVSLPVDNSGVPVTSVWRDGKWLCPDCLRGKPIVKQVENSGE